MGNASLDGTVTANGSFDVICTGDGCGGSKTFTHGFAENKPPSFNFQGREDNLAQRSRGLGPISGATIGCQPSASYRSRRPCTTKAWSS